MVSDCGLKRIGDLDFNMFYGSCFSSNDVMVLCFDRYETEQCRRGTSPTGEFTEIEKTNYDHVFIRLSASKSNY